MLDGRQIEQEQQQTKGGDTEPVEALAILSMNAVDLLSFITEEQIANPLLEIGRYRASTEAVAPRGDGAAGETQQAPSSARQLDDYLCAQLPQLGLSEAQCALLRQVIGYIDRQTGYFAATIETIGAELHRTPAEVRWAVDRVRALEPAGVGAFDLRDCLRLQAQRQGRWDEVLERMIDAHLDDIARGRVRTIARRLHISEKRARDDIAWLSELDPKPGARFGDAHIMYVVPDVCAVYHEGEWSVALNGVRSRMMYVNDSYIQIAKMTTEPDVAGYFADKLQRTKQIIAAMRTREWIVRDVLEQVLPIQQDYALGTGERTPLTQAQVAEMMELSLDTIRCAVANKYIQLPCGVVPFRALFTDR